MIILRIVRIKIIFSIEFAILRNRAVRCKSNRSAEEVIAYLEKLRIIIQYLGASDCKLNEGSMISYSGISYSRRILAILSSRNSGCLLRISSKLIALVEQKVINSSVAKEVFEVLFAQDIDPEQYVADKGLNTVNDEGALRKTIEEIIAANPQSVEDYRNGKEKAIGFLVGQTMKTMKGKADPVEIQTPKAV